MGIDAIRSKNKQISMKSFYKKKKKYLTVHGYGMGGIWQYIYAYDYSDIEKKYPGLEVVKEKPLWLIEQEKNDTLKTYDIDENHTKLHQYKRKGP